MSPREPSARRPGTLRGSTVHPSALGLPKGLLASDRRFGYHRPESESAPTSEPCMSDQDPMPSTDLPSTQVSSTGPDGPPDSIRTQSPPSIPETRLDPGSTDASIPTRFADESYAT